MLDEVHEQVVILRRAFVSYDTLITFAGIAIDNAGKLQTRWEGISAKDIVHLLPKASLHRPIHQDQQPLLAFDAIRWMVTLAYQGSSDGSYPSLHAHACAVLTESLALEQGHFRRLVRFEYIYSQQDACTSSSRSQDECLKLIWSIEQEESNGPTRLAKANPRVPSTLLLSSDVLRCLTSSTTSGACKAGKKSTGPTRRQHKPSLSGATGFGVFSFLPRQVKGKPRARIKVGKEKSEGEITDFFDCWCKKYDPASHENGERMRWQYLRALKRSSHFKQHYLDGDIPYTLWRRVFDFHINETQGQAAEITAWQACCVILYSHLVDRQNDLNPWLGEPLLPGGEDPQQVRPLGGPHLSNPSAHEDLFVATAGTDDGAGTTTDDNSELQVDNDSGNQTTPAVTSGTPLIMPWHTLIPADFHDGQVSDQAPTLHSYPPAEPHNDRSSHLPLFGIVVSVDPAMLSVKDQADVLPRESSGSYCADGDWVVAPPDSPSLHTLGPRPGEPLINADSHLPGPSNFPPGPHIFTDETVFDPRRYISPSFSTPTRNILPSSDPGLTDDRSYFSELGQHQGNVQSPTTPGTLHSYDDSFQNEFGPYDPPAFYRARGTTGHQNQDLNAIGLLRIPEVLEPDSIGGDDAEKSLFDDDFDLNDFMHNLASSEVHHVLSNVAKKLSTDSSTTSASTVIDQKGKGKADET
ncbi:uncharacterized protein AB675_447 [Cyphellophora attinorum]|uniref:Uncharacterized protein n=1 Tax=Cyphellophora attinorum TaxID=1664694 RepID=A0A0N1HI20_9EURO|nr:uncharacterized protein AB675_447 [Phialophora attinorum]KPI45862.1 hypothetical protein AB675_447 [Phialophora attinorum]